MAMTPKKGNRNTTLTGLFGVLAVGTYITKGAASGDWSGFEWVMIALGVVKAASSHRARGEYAYVEERPITSDTYEST